MAHKWAEWLHNLCRLGGPQRFKWGGGVSSGPQVGRMATNLPRYWMSAMLRTGGEGRRWPTNGLGGDIPLAAWGVPNASEQGTKSEVAHKWAG